jgi:O-antigen/teichoic acid export membrane protein
MSGRRRSAYATMAGSTASTLVAALQSLVLLPLYISEIGVGPYGAWLATGEMLVWLLAFDFGIPNLLIQRTGAALARGDYRSIGRHMGSSFVALVLLATVVYGAVCALAPWAASVVGGSVDLVGVLRIAGLATALTIVAHGLVGLARGLQDTVLVQSASLTGTVLGFGTTAALLLAHWGLDAIAYGLLVRASFTLLGGIAFLAFRTDRRIVSAIRPCAESARDIAKNAPPLFAAGLGYALMNNSMVTLAAVMVRPEAATVLGVTRKAADLARMVLDMVGHASYGGFANLIALGQSDRTRAVYRELQATFFLAATALLSAYVACNSALVTVWVGAELFGGLGLTVLVALGTIAASWSYLQIGLYRSMGEHNRASAALLVECASRLSLMVAGGALFGLPGFAGAAVVTAMASGVWASRQIGARLSGGDSSAKAWVGRTAPILAAVLVGALGSVGGWGYVVGVGLLACAFSAGLLLFTDPGLLPIRRRLAR